MTSELTDDNAASLATTCVAIVNTLHLGLEAEAVARQLFQPSLSLTGQALSLLEGVKRMQLVEDLPRSGLKPDEQATQIERMRKMLLAMASDVRVIMIKLAERLAVLRHARAMLSATSQQRLAHTVLDLYAPLANRLGLWQIKWELEDLCLRILEPQTYQKIAQALDFKRNERVAYMQEVREALARECEAQGLEAEVAARAKHIYSIWNKLKRKGYVFEQLSDIHAVRIIVGSVAECYTALGVVHNLWIPVPSQFDDYIAKPKANGYRSLHTAVVGPEQKIIEVQIRTRDMHEASEHGVAAHWLYKEGGFQHKAAVGEKERAMHEQMQWLRQLLEWNQEEGGAPELTTLKATLFEDSIFVLTPQGKVIDLPMGATAIDFAYTLHTNLGHRCRGAKLDGVMVPLNTPLVNGVRVEILSAKEGGPSRDWLNHDLGYVQSNRARSKIRAWFNALAHDEQLAQGRALLEKELQREGKTALAWEQVAKRLDKDSVDELLLALAKGEVNSRELSLAVRISDDVEHEHGHEADDFEVDLAKSHQGQSGVLIVGVDQLLTSMAGCCQAVPPDPIIGFITRGRGVSIHRHDCRNIELLSTELKARLIPADWGRLGKRLFAVDIAVLANDREGLLRDVSELITKARAHITAVSSFRKAHGAVTQMSLHLTLELADGAQLVTVLNQLSELPDVVYAKRR